MKKEKEYTKADWGLFVIRLMFIGFMLHGIQKFASLDSTATFFASLGIPAPEIMAPLVAFVETFGSLMVVLGIGTSYATPILAFVMLVAISTAHLGGVLAKGFPFGLFAAELPIAYFLASVGIFLIGPGKISLQHKN